MQTLKQVSDKMIAKPPELPAPSAPVEWVNPFTRFNPDVHTQAGLAHRAARDWAYAVAEGGAVGLVLWSKGFGCGKTLLASCAYDFVNSVSHEGRTQRITLIDAGDLFSSIKDLYAKGEPVTPRFDDWARGPVVMDDFGKEYVKSGSEDWAREQFYKLINRLSERRGLLITTNWTPEELSAFVGGASWSRLVGMCGPKGFVNMSDIPDYRLRKGGWKK